MPDAMTTKSLLDAVERYLDLMFDGDVERFDRVFAQSAQLHGLRDGNLRLQYMAGMALNVSREGSIYAEMLNYRRFPENLITGSDQRKTALRMAMELPGAGGR